MIDLTPAMAPPVAAAMPVRPPSGLLVPHMRVDLARMPVSGTPAPASYYAAAQGKQGVALLGALHTIVSNGQIDLGYRQARDAMFGFVDDPGNDDTVADIYSGRTYSNITNRTNAYSAGLNTEHTWPQSHGAVGAAKDDLNVLRPSETGENGRRGNGPYGIVVDPTWTSAPAQGIQGVSELGTDASGKQVFEPRPGVRGEIARGLLYFYTRYAPDAPTKFDATDFRYELPTLLAWSKAEPVSDAERARNDRVFAVQGNRNPFVDNPAWIDQIDWASIAGGSKQG